MSAQIKNRRRSWRAARWLALGVRWARLSAFCTAALALALFVSTRRARGDVGEKMISLGRELLPMADLLQGAQRARINGESIYIASTVTEEPLVEVLDRYQRHCQEHTGGLAEEFVAVPAQAKTLLAARVPAAWSQRLGIIREQRDDEGMIACIAQNGEGGIPGWVDRVTRFLADGEVSHLGNFRYAYVSKTSAGRTHLLTTFTEGSFNLYRVLGLEKVVKRDELDGVPLPADALMPMTFRVDGMPYAVQAFRSPQHASAIAEYYLDALPRLGWEKLTGPGDLFSTVVMRRQGVTLIMSAIELGEDGKANVVLTEGVATIAEDVRR